MKMKLALLAETLVAVSAKAARIARTMRSEQALFELLVEEKTGDAANKRFVQDFKTLGDVLVQETVRHDVTKQFSGMAEHIYGEESNQFTNTLGESVTVTIQPTQEETCNLLGKVLDGNSEAARLLAEAVHADLERETYPELETVTAEVDSDDLGIWIDPIDSTAQYIHGSDGVSEDDIHSEGLQCVVVIIGVYLQSSGCPILGVCHQPFFKQDTATRMWEGRCVWGLAYGDTKTYHIPHTQTMQSSSGSTTEKPCLVTSSSEKAAIQERLSTKFRVRHAAGAGYKLLCVIDGRAAGYVLTARSTFKWDTCGPHAVLLALGGDIVDYPSTLQQMNSVSESEQAEVVKKCRVGYSQPDAGDRSVGEKWSNASGFIGFVNLAQLAIMVQTLTT